MLAPSFLAIEGPIGVGKTTLARLLHTRYASDLLLEHFADNPFLPLFYQEPERYALPTQLHFLLDRFDQLSEATRTQPLLISDYMFAKDRLFAELNLAAPHCGATARSTTCSHRPRASPTR